MLSLGIPLARVVAWSTVNPAKIFDVFKNRGTLAPGAPADITVLEMRSGNFEFVDAFKNVRAGDRKLFASATVLRGKWIRP
jgi:dihydroorotase